MQSQSWLTGTKLFDELLMQKGDALQLTIANHQLEGKKVALKKPFAILQPEATDQAGLCQSYKVAPLCTYRLIHRPTSFTRTPVVLIGDWRAT